MTAVSRDFLDYHTIFDPQKSREIAGALRKEYFFRKYFNPLCRAIEAQSLDQW